MKTLIKLLLAALLATNYHNLLATSIEVGGSISIHTTWDVDTVKVVSDIIVERDATLTIDRKSVV